MLSYKRFELVILSGHFKHGDQCSQVTLPMLGFI